MAWKPSFNLASAGKAAGYVFFFIIATIFFIVVTFPDEKMRQFVEVQASNAIGAPLSIEEGGLTGLGVLDFSGLQIRLGPVAKPTKWPGMDQVPEPAKGKGKKKGPKFRFINGDRLHIDASITSLLFGDAYEAAFDGEFMGGELKDGVFKVDKETGKATVTVGVIDSLLLGPEKLLKGATAGDNSAGYDLRGQLSGSLSVTWGKRPTDLRGEIDLAIAGARIVKPMIPPTKAMPAPIELSDIELGTIRIKIGIDEVSKIPGLGKRSRRSRRTKNPKAGVPAAPSAEPVAIHFAEIGNDSEEVVLSVDPRSVIRIAPGKPFKQATMDLHMAVQILPAYIDKKVTDKKSGETSQPNKLLSMVMKDRKIRRSTLNGVIGFKCVGPIAKIKCDLERPRRGSFKKAKPKFGRDKKDPKDDLKKDKKKPGTSAKRPSSTSRRGSSSSRPSAAERARDRAKKRRDAMEKKRATAKPRLGPRADTPSRPSRGRTNIAKPMTARPFPAKIEPSPTPLPKAEEPEEGGDSEEGGEEGGDSEEGGEEGGDSEEGGEEGGDSEEGGEEEGEEEE